MNDTVPVPAPNVQQLCRTEPPSALGEDSMRAPLMKRHLHSVS
jgi:hypothetical protein